MKNTYKILLGIIGIILLIPVGCWIEHGRAVGVGNGYHKKLNESFVGRDSGRMTNGIAYAEKECLERGEPPESYFMSRQMAAASAGTVANNLLTMIGAEEIEHRLTVAAIALERYRLSAGRYPEKLAELLPTHLKSVPIDLMDGQPMRYRRRDDGRYDLYSIGPNGIDENGNASSAAAAGTNKVALGSAMTWQSAPDWVWPLPAEQDEIEADNEKLVNTSTGVSIAIP